MERKLEFLSENFQFLVIKFSLHLNRLVFVMIPMYLYLNLVIKNVLHLWYPSKSGSSVR